MLKRLSSLAICLAALASWLPSAAAESVVDWKAVLASETDPRITLNPPDCAPAPAGTLPGICVRFNGPEAAGASDGYVSAADIRSGALSEDGSTKAVIPVVANGPGGMIGFLIYQVATPNPWLVAVQAGLYQAGVTIEKRTLVVKQPVYTPSEGAYSLTEITTTVYDFEGDALNPISQSTANVTIRYTDWNAAFTQDPWITTGPEHCASVPQSVANAGALCVLVAPFGSDPITQTLDDTFPVINGYILATPPLFGDIGGDGMEEAIIPVQSGGPAGTIGVLVYRQADTGPRLVAAVATYRGGVTLTQASTALEVTEPIIDDPEATGPRFRQATYALEGDVLTLIDVEGFGATSVPRSNP